MLGALSAPLGRSECNHSVPASDQKIIAPHLQFFVVSDFHIGWSGENQPTVDTQRKLMQKLRGFAPRLDFIVDTGDIYHAKQNPIQRAVSVNTWRSIVTLAGVPVLYVPGNHELFDHTMQDNERYCTRVASLPNCADWLFSYNGINLACIAQVDAPNYVSPDTWSWLAHTLHADDPGRQKPTILLAHNALEGTTATPQLRDYRVLVNSQPILQAIDQWPNIIAWMHGHNHGFDMVLRNRKAFISNGRMGGFIPSSEYGPVGQGSLGGILVTVYRDHANFAAIDLATGTAPLGIKSFTSLDVSLSHPLPPTRDATKLYFGSRAINSTNPSASEYQCWTALNSKAQRLGVFDPQEQSINPDPELKNIAQYTRARATSTVNRSVAPLRSPNGPITLRNCVASIPQTSDGGIHLQPSIPNSSYSAKLVIWGASNRGRRPFPLPPGARFAVSILYSTASTTHILRAKVGGLAKASMVDSASPSPSLRIASAEFEVPSSSEIPEVAVLIRSSERSFFVHQVKLLPLDAGTRKRQVVYVRVGLDFQLVGGHIEASLSEQWARARADSVPGIPSEVFLVRLGNPSFHPVRIASSDRFYISIQSHSSVLIAGTSFDVTIDQERRVTFPSTGVSCVKVVILDNGDAELGDFFVPHDLIGILEA